MNNHCRKTPINNHCGTESIDITAKTICKPFSVCLPFGRELKFNGECLMLEGTSNIKDGEYGIIVVENGCIVGARPNPTFDYTPPPCTPAASPCGGSEGATSINLQPGLCNLLSIDASGRLGATLNIEAAGGINITGCGTASSPLTIGMGVVDSEKTYINSGNSNISITGEGNISDPYIISHKISSMEGEYAGFTIDDGGHIINYKDSGAGYISSVIPGPGITITTQGSTANISIEKSQQEPGDWLLGGWGLTTDLSGRITDMTRYVTVPAGSYNGINTIFTVNEFGSITGVENVIRQVDTQFSMFFDGERDKTLMTFTTSQVGYFRIVYKGNLGVYTGNIGSSSESGSGSGSGSGSTTPVIKSYYPLVSPYRFRINGKNVPAYVKLESKYVTEVQVLSYAPYAPGEHTVELVGPATTEENPIIFDDTSFMDVYVVGEI